MSWGLEIRNSSGTVIFDPSTYLIRAIAEVYGGQTGSVVIETFDINTCAVFFRPDNPAAKFWWSFNSTTKTLSWSSDTVSYTYVTVLMGG